MRTQRSRRGMVEAGMLGGVAVLVLAEIAAIRGGLGPFFGMVGLGYMLVLGFIYWMYRRARSLDSAREGVLATDIGTVLGVGLERQSLSNGEVFRRSRVSMIDGGMLGGVAVLVLAEVAAVSGGVGPFFGIVGLGYVLVMGFVYWMYRRAEVLDVAESRMPGTDIGLAAGPGLPRRVLREVDLFRYLSDEQMNRVASLGRQMEIPEGKVLGEQGEPGYFLFVVIEGKAELSARSLLGEVTVRIVGPTESFPLASLVGMGRLITSASAMTPMKVLAIPSSRLMELCRNEPDLGQKVYAAIAEALAMRYQKTLRHVTTGAEVVLKDAELWANL